MGCVGQGNVNAALQASQAMQDLQPEVIAFLGTAGGLKQGVGLGDVVFATKVYGYEAGKETDRQMLARPDVGLADPQLKGFARRIAAADNWQRPRSDSDGLEAPRLHVEAIVAGEKIQSGQREALRERLPVSFNDAVAVEMEGLGFLTAAHHMGGMKAMVIRGISDLLSDISPEHDERVQPLACADASRLWRDESRTIESHRPTGAGSPHVLTRCRRSRSAGTCHGVPRSQRRHRSVSAARRISAASWRARRAGPFAPRACTEA